jgi:hypothetical protein
VGIRRLRQLTLDTWLATVAKRPGATNTVETILSRFVIGG